MDDVGTFTAETTSNLTSSGTTATHNFNEFKGHVFDYDVGILTVE